MLCPQNEASTLHPCSFFLFLYQYFFNPVQNDIAHHHIWSYRSSLMWFYSAATYFLQKSAMIVSPLCLFVFFNVFSFGLMIVPQDLATLSRAFKVYVDWPFRSLSQPSSSHERPLRKSVASTLPSETAISTLPSHWRFSRVYFWSPWLQFPLYPSQSFICFCGIFACRVATPCCLCECVSLCACPHACAS